MYNSLIHPYLTYCINAWSSTNQTYLKSLNTTQKKICAHTLWYNQATSLDRYLSAQKCLPLAKLIKLQEGILAYIW